MKKALMVSLIAVMLASCATDDPNQRAKMGAVIGAVAGAALGHSVENNKKGVLIGAAMGALAGAGAGNYMDKQQQEMEAALAAERANHAIEIQRLENETLKIDIASEVSFDFGSAGLKPAFTPTLKKVADILQRYSNTIIHVVGHTDSVGSESYNVGLSQQRAESVVGYFASRGVTMTRLVAAGRGESEPRATNETEAGRQLNRRVEIYVKPIIEGQESNAYQAP
ncbi:MAG: outer membrane protein OmpA-like peptidoglycan-associated protein [Methylophagaceae bacterium]|jgi:outer membrane protein OmpA-like peptidoglycan-associated protein